jgi:hypothetical protein
MIDAGTVNLDPFSLDVIVHSTGGPVVRHWLNHYLQDVCGGDLARCPVRSLIMLAPANFGSRLAAQGGFETGKRILEGIELGSPVLWRIAHGDLFTSERRYPCAGGQPDLHADPGMPGRGDARAVHSRWIRTSSSSCACATRSATT